MYGRNSKFVKVTTSTKPESMRSLHNEDDVELAERDSPPQMHRDYSVSVSGGGAEADTVSMGPGIRTTTVVTQRVS